MLRGLSTLVATFALLAVLAIVPAVLSLPDGTVASLLLSEADAQTAPLPIEASIDGVFGPDALLEGGYTGVVVTLTNHTASAHTGFVDVSVSDWTTGAEHHRVAVDLPGGSVRRVQLTVFVPAAGTELAVRYVDDDGDVLALASQSVAYAGGTTSVVVIAEQPARLRAGLLDLQIEEAAPGSMGAYPGSVRTQAIPIGGVALDGRTGDPILPTDPQAYSTVRVVIASASTLARAGEAERRALEDFVVAGGTLVIAPRSSADYALDVVRAHVGDVTTWAGAFAPSHLAPPETLLLHCSAADVEDGAGCARSLGAGIVRLVPWDLTSPPSGTAGVETWSRALVLALVMERSERGGAALPFGAGLDPTDAGWWDGSSTFAYLRRALDPNEGYRTSLALVAVLLFLYVLVVGPIHFKLIERRNQPTLALITTPLLAMGCAALLFGVGYLGKGIVMRYRRLSVVELTAGSERGTSRSYTGFFFTRPSTGALDTLPGALPRRVAAPGGIAGPVSLHRADHVRAEGIRGGLWDTLFLREDRMVDVGGGIRFEADGARIAAVVNDSELPLRSAFLVDTIGSAFVIGDVPAHGRAPVPEGTSWYLYENTSGWYGEGGDATTSSISALLRLSSEEAPLARGIQSLLGAELVGSDSASLYAWIDPEDPPSTDPSFSREWDRRLVRVRASVVPRSLAAPRMWRETPETPPLPGAPQ